MPNQLSTPPLEPSPPDLTLPKLHVDVAELADIILILQRCFLFNLSKELSKGHVSFPQFFLLGHLQQQGMLTMTAIAEKMSHTTAAATGLVDRLEKIEYVRRSHDLADRRKVMVSITRKGTLLVETVRADVAKNLERLLQQLEPAEQKSWLQIYRKIFLFCNQH